MVGILPKKSIIDEAAEIAEGFQNIGETYENLSGQSENLKEQYEKSIKKLENLQKQSEDLSLDFNDLSFRFGKQMIEIEYTKKMYKANSSELPKIQEELNEALVIYEKENKEKERTKAEQVALRKQMKERTEILCHGTEEEKNKVFEQIKEGITEITRNYIKRKIEKEGVEGAEKSYTDFDVKAYNNKAKECAEKAVIAEKKVVEVQDRLDSAERNLKKVEQEVEEIKAASKSIGLNDARTKKATAEAAVKQLISKNITDKPLEDAKTQETKAINEVKKQEENAVPKGKKVELKTAETEVLKARKELENAKESVRVNREEEKDNIALANFHVNLFKEVQLELEQEKCLTATPAKENKSFVSQHPSKNKGKSNAEQITENQIASKTPKQSTGMEL